jgi:hypothetical protein
MTARDQVEALKIQAIDLLLKERHAIDEELNLLGYGKEKAPATYRRRGRPRKNEADHNHTTTDAIRAGDSSNELHGASRTPDTESDSR